MGNTRIHASASTPYEYKAEPPKEEPKKEPQEPEQPKEPESQAEKQEVIISQGTKTGDESPTGHLLIVSMVTAIGGVVILAFRRKMLFK